MRRSNKKSTVKGKSKKRKSPLKKYQAAGPVPATGVSMTPTAGQYGFGTGNLGSSGFGSASLGGDSFLSTPQSYNTAASNFNTLYGGSTTPNFSSGHLSNVSDPSFTGLDTSLDTSLDAPRSLGDYYKDTKTAFGDRSNKADIMKAEYKPDPKGPSKQERDQAVAEGVSQALPGITGVIAQAAKKKTIDDPNRYYNKDTKAKLEEYNRKIATSKGVSSVGQSIATVGASLAPVLGPFSLIPVAVGGIMAAAGEGAAADYGTKQGKVGADYDRLVADRKKLEKRAEEQKAKNAAMNAQQYFNVPSARYGGLMKYMGGGFTKVTGPSHENGGVPMDLSGDGVVDSELVGRVSIEEMKHGGNASKKYLWSDHRKTGGMSFAKKFEQMKKKGARPGDVEKLRIEQELAAKRDPSKLYAKYGGTMDYMEEGGVPNKYKGFSKLPEGVQRKIDSDLAMKYGYGGMMKYGYGGKMNYMEEGGKLPKDVLESRLESHMSDTEAQNYLDSYKGGGLWANIHAKRKRIASGSGEKMRKPGSEGAPTAKALRESKRDGGYLEYKKGGFKSPAWTRKEGQNPSGGLNAKGRASAKAEGSNLKAPVSSGTNPRRVSFAARFAGMKGPMKNEQGEPTRKALALKKWGFGSEEAARNFANRNKKSAKYGGLMKYQTGGPDEERVVRTDTGKFLAEYGAPLASVAGAAGDIGMTMSQKYTPVAPITARDVKAEQVFIDRAKDKRVGARESELVAAKRAIQQRIGSGQGQLNAARMVSLRAQEEAAQNVYDINRQASATEQQLNQQAKLQAAMANQRKDLETSQSRRGESLRKQSFENMRKKYMGSVMGELGNELASGLYKKEYINRTLPAGVDEYEVKEGSIKLFMDKYGMTRDEAEAHFWKNYEAQKK